MVDTAIGGTFLDFKSRNLNLLGMMLAVIMARL